MSEDDSLYVLDGQQRLISSTLLIAAIRKIISELMTEEQAKGEFNRILPLMETLLFSNYKCLISIDNKYQKILDKIVVNPGIFPDEIKQKKVFSPGTESNLILNYEDFFSRCCDYVGIKYEKKTLENDEIRRYFIIKDALDLESEEAKGNPEIIRKLIELYTVFSNFCVSAVYVSNLNEAYEAFEFINNRGLKLTPLELLRNHIYSLCYEKDEDLDDDREGIASKWESINTKLRKLGIKRKRKSKNLTDDEQEERFKFIQKRNDSKYLRYFTNATVGFVQADAVYDKLTTSIDSKANAIKFLEEFDKSLQFFEIIFSKNNNSKSTNLLNRIIYGFIRGNFESYAPLALSIYLRDPENYEDDLLRVMKEYDRFYVLGVVSGIEKTGMIEKATSDLAVRYYNGEISIDEAVAEVHGFIKASKFENIKIGLELKEWNEASVKYVLSELYNRNQKHLPVLISMEDINVEHIMPQKPNDEWNVSIEDHTAGCYQIGNQIILRDSCNMSIRNIGFLRKKYAYVGEDYTRLKDKNPSLEYDKKTGAVFILYDNDESTRFSVTENKQYCDLWDSLFMNEDDWDINTIRARSSFLAEKIIETWGKDEIEIQAKLD